MRARVPRPRPLRSLASYRRQHQGPPDTMPPEPTPPAAPGARRPTYYECPECLGELVAVVGHGPGSLPMWMCPSAIGEQVLGPLGPQLPDPALHSVMRYYRQGDLLLLERERLARSVGIEAPVEMTA